MATGRLPFNGDSVTETIDRIAHAQPEAVARFNYDVPPELEAIIKKALRKKREERYQTARDLLSDLKNLKQESESGARPDYAGAQRGASPAAATGEIAAAQPTTSAEYLIGEIKKHRRLAALALAILMVTLGGGAVGLYWFSRQAVPGTRPSAPLQTMKIVRLTVSGNAGSVNISPDGKYVAYRLRTDDGLQSL